MALRAVISRPARCAAEVAVATSNNQAEGPMMQRDLTDRKETLASAIGHLSYSE